MQIISSTAHHTGVDDRATGAQVPHGLNDRLARAGVGDRDVSVFSRAQLNFRRRPKGRRCSPICMAMSYSVTVVFLHLPLLAAGRVLRVIIEKERDRPLDASVV